MHPYLNPTYALLFRCCRQKERRRAFNTALQISARRACNRAGPLLFLRSLWFESVFIDFKPKKDLRQYKRLQTKKAHTTNWRVLHQAQEIAVRTSLVVVAVYALTYLPYATLQTAKAVLGADWYAEVRFRK